jgi:biotin carboxyl carrier protein
VPHSQTYFSGFNNAAQKQMKLIAEIAGQKHHVTFERDARDDSRLIAFVDDQRYDINAREIAPGVQLLFHNQRVYQCRIDKSSSTNASVVIYVGNEPYILNIADPKRIRAGQRGKADAGEGAAQIFAPMPGKIVRVLIASGASVEAGDGLIVVEAMKMQNEMKSPRAGIVTAVNVETGATVNAGDLLAVIE